MSDITCDIVSILLAKRKMRKANYGLAGTLRRLTRKTSCSTASKDVLGKSKQKHEIARKRSLLLRRCLSKFQLCRWYIFVARSTRLSRN